MYWAPSRSGWRDKYRDILHQWSQQAACPPRSLTLPWLPRLSSLHPNVVLSGCIHCQTLSDARTYEDPSASLYISLAMSLESIYILCRRPLCAWNASGAADALTETARCSCILTQLHSISLYIRSVPYLHSLLDGALPENIPRCYIMLDLTEYSNA